MMPFSKQGLDQVVASTLLTMTLGLFWGAILTIVITLVARGLGA